MRDLIAHPIIAEEVAAACERHAADVQQQYEITGTVGGMDALLLRTAAATVRAADALLNAIEYRREGPDRLRYVTPWGAATDLMMALNSQNPGWAAQRAELETLRTRLKKVERRRDKDGPPGVD